MDPVKENANTPFNNVLVLREVCAFSLYIRYHVNSKAGTVQGVVIPVCTVDTV